MRGEQQKMEFSSLAPLGAERVPHLLLDTEGVKPRVARVHPPRRGENRISVGKGTFFVPAAHG
jgi:hypothetical protein